MGLRRTRGLAFASVLIRKLWDVLQTSTVAYTNNDHTPEASPQATIRVTIFSPNSMTQITKRHTVSHFLLSSRLTMEMHFSLILLTGSRSISTLQHLKSVYVDQCFQFLVQVSSLVSFSSFQSPARVVC